MCTTLTSGDGLIYIESRTAIDRCRRMLDRGYVRVFGHFGPSENLQRNTLTCGLHTPVRGGLLRPTTVGGSQQTY